MSDDAPASQKPRADSRAEAPGIFRTALTLLPFQAVFRGGEAVLPLLLAAWLGRDAETDLYKLLAAYFIFAAALLSAAFQDSAVVPVLIEIETKAPEKFSIIAGSLLGHTLAVSAALAVVLGSIASAILYFVSPLRTLAIFLTCTMAALLVVTAVRAFYVGLMNARGKFRAHPIASGIGMALTLTILDLGRHALGVRVIPLAMIAGELVAISLLWFFSTRELGAMVRPNLQRPEPILRIFRLLRFEATGQVITRINPFIDQLMAGLAGVIGGGTLLGYATDVASLPTSIIQATVLTVFLTRVSQEAEHTEKFLGTVRRTLAIVSAMLAGLSLLFAVFRVPLARILFLHGAMDEAGVAKIADMLPYALVGVVPFGALLILARAHVARQNSRIMQSMGILNASLNVGFNALFVRRLGLAGIALSTSMTYVVVAAVFWIRLQRNVRAKG